jgi:leucyl-tRNA synthetase
VRREAPVALATAMMAMPDNVTVAELQRILNEDLMPRLATALGHLADVESLADYRFTGTVDDEEETTTPTVVLEYLDIKGVAEPIRLALFVGDVPFEENFDSYALGALEGNTNDAGNTWHGWGGTNTFVSADLAKEHETQRLHVDISLVDNDKLDTNAFRNWRSEYANAEFITNDAGDFMCDWEIEKMSKSKYNVQTPDELVEKFGADTLRCYEMFLGPVEQHKPWDTKGINGVHNFLRKLWRLYHGSENQFAVSDEAATADELRTLHKTIKKVTEDLDRLSWNTVVSALMICVNELTEQKCNKRNVLEVLPILLSPYAPHLSEELWERLGMSGSVTEAAWPAYDEAHLVAATISYPVQFNGKMRFNLECDPSLSPAEVEKLVMAHERTAHYLEGKAPRKVIVVPGRIINIVA